MAAAASALPSSHQSEEDLKAQQEAELSALQQQLQQLSVQMEEVGGDIKQLTVSIQQVMTNQIKWNVILTIYHITYYIT